MFSFWCSTCTLHFSILQIFATTDCLFNWVHRVESSCCPPPFAKAGDIKTHWSLCLSVPLSATKTLIWLISSEVLMIEHWYLACMFLVTSPFNWYYAVTLIFDLLQGQSCCRAGTTILRICLFRLLGIQNNLHISSPSYYINMSVIPLGFRLFMPRNIPYWFRGKRSRSQCIDYWKWCFFCT